MLKIFSFRALHLRILCIFGLCLFNLAQAQDSTMTMNYRGQPPPSAMAPSISSFSQDNCLVAISGAISSTIIGFAAGSYMMDEDCSRRKWATFLSNNGLKVAAVAIACSAREENWDAMMMSGTPCPIDGLVGDAARNEWIKRHPEKFKKLYGTVPPLVDLAAVNSNESE
jgi:hypothetical protein